MEDKKWISELKVGNLVFIGNYLTRVEKITPTGRIKVMGQYYNPQTGYVMGGDVFSVSQLREATNEALNEYYNNQFVAKVISEFNKRKITVEQALKINGLLGLGVKYRDE